MKVNSQPIITDIKSGCKKKVHDLINGNRPAVVVIQGMPASGKTTFLNNVSEFMDKNNIPHSVIHSDNYIKDFSRLLSDEKTYRIGIIDVFKKNGLFFNSKSKPDKPHGELVKEIITNSAPHTEVTQYEVKAKKIDGQFKFDHKSVLKQLKRVKEEKFDYLNLSLCFPHEYKAGGKSFNPDELHYPEIVSQLKGNMPKGVKNIIDEIETIADSGTEVYISSGNGHNIFNLLSLSRNTHTIGALDKQAKSPVPYFTDNSLVENYMELPYVFTNSNSPKYRVSLDLAKLSKHELKKKIATKKDYELLRNTVNEQKVKSDFNGIQYLIPFSIPVAQRNKIYEIDKLADIYGKDILKNFKTTDGVTHSDVSMRQFFNMNAKGEKHIISPKKTHNVRYSISGTSFSPPQAIAEDIILNETARKEIYKKYDVFSQLLKYI